MRLRDYDEDGKITEEEHLRHSRAMNEVKTQFNGLEDT
jgi:hypothetical protein